MPYLVVLFWPASSSPAHQLNSWVPRGALQPLPMCRGLPSCPEHNTDGLHGWLFSTSNPSMAHSCHPGFTLGWDPGSYYSWSFSIPLHRKALLSSQKQCTPFSRNDEIWPFHIWAFWAFQGPVTSGSLTMWLPTAGNHWKLGFASTSRFTPRQTGQ